MGKKMAFSLNWNGFVLNLTNCSKKACSDHDKYYLRIEGSNREQRTWFSLHYADTWVWGPKAPRFRHYMTTAKPSFHPLEHLLLRPRLCRSSLRFWVCLFGCSRSSSLHFFSPIVLNVLFVKLGFRVLGTLLGWAWSFTIKLKRYGWLVLIF